MLHRQWRLPPPQETHAPAPQVLILDDQVLIRQWVRTVLAPRGYVVHEAARGEDALDLVRAIGWLHLALIDVHLPGAAVEGIEAARSLVATYRLRCVMLTSLIDAATRAAASLAGALGYLVKDVASDAVLLQTVAAALRGDPLPDPLAGLSPAQALHVARQQVRVRAQWAQLTSHQRQVAELASQGRSNDEIAQLLGVAPSTIQTHIQNLLAKLHLSSRRELHDEGIYLAAARGYRREGGIDE